MEDPFIGDVFKDFKEDKIIAMVERSIEIIKSKPKPLLELEGNFFVLGDIHGSSKTLRSFLRENWEKPDYKFLFLGDYIDRGENSIGVIIHLLEIYNQSPDRVFLLRGNHDSRYGESRKDENSFKKECDSFGLSGFYLLVMEFFEYLPFAAILNDSVFCVHGGFSSSVISFEQIKSIGLPIDSNKRDPINDGLLWSDPSSNISDFGPSQRGRGEIYGKVAVDTFLRENNISYIVRGHQLNIKGYEEDMDGRVITISTSENLGNVPRLASYVIILPNKKPKRMIVRTHSS